MVNVQLENYNYWRDSRVQGSMFNPCWKIVLQEAREVVVSLDEDYLITPIYDAELDACVQRWIEIEADFTQRYRELTAEAKLAQARWEEERALQVDRYGGYWGIPREIKSAIADAHEQWRRVDRSAGEEFDSLMHRAESECPISQISKDLGLKSFTIRGETYEFCLRLQSKFEVCSQCEGSGKVVDPNIDCNGISMDEFRADPEFEEEYFSGRWDITCPTCRGRRVEAIPQFPKWLSEAIEEHDHDQWDHIREICAERAMGA